MKEQSEHLSNAQIEDYGAHTSGEGLDGDLAVEKHLADCPTCRSRVLEFQRRRLGLIAASSGMSTLLAPELPEREVAGPDWQDSGASDLHDLSRDQKLRGRELPTSPMAKPKTTPDCLSEEDLCKWVAGISSEAVTSERMRHVSACNRCTTLLRAYEQHFSDDFSSDESTLIKQLKSASPDWQRQAAHKTLQAALATVAGEESFSEAEHSGESSMERNPAPPGRFSFWKWSVIPAAAACVVIMVFWYALPPTPEKVEKLLAQAYTQHRTLEMRWPGARWSDFSGTMGSDHTSTPRALMEAEEALNKLPETERGKDKWIRARAEKEIAAGNSHAAVTLLEPVASSATAPVELRLDLAVAYFAEGKQTHDTQWYEKSRVALDGILRQEPGNTVALFNRALVLELNNPKMAKNDWEKFVHAETDLDWRSEGETHLRKLPGK